MIRSYSNGNIHPPVADRNNGFMHPAEEPVVIKGFAVTYDRKFNCGNYESLTPAITIWVRARTSENEALGLHHAKERVRRMARENVKKQWQQLQGNDEVVFLGLQPPADGSEDTILVRTVSVSLVYKVNLGDYNSITPGYTDWADLQNVAHSPGQLHIALERMWRSLWQNTLDEISRARGKGATDEYFGLPPITVEDLSANSTDTAHAAFQPTGGVVATSARR